MTPCAVISMIIHSFSCLNVARTMPRPLRIIKTQLVHCRTTLPDFPRPRPSFKRRITSRHLRNGSRIPIGSLRAFAKRKLWPIILDCSRKLRSNHNVIKYSRQTLCLIVACLVFSSVGRFLAAVARFPVRGQRHLRHEFIFPK
ncbi:hypothetical protein AC1031_022013 [Aphanomyces cochlioides]|nr:hypothetical protein AC1031_022013 [Aphanomyces cochlioides]